MLVFWISFASLAGLPATDAPVGLTRGWVLYPVGTSNILVLAVRCDTSSLEDATPIDVAGRLSEVAGDSGRRPGTESTTLGLP